MHACQRLLIAFAYVYGEIGGVETQNRLVWKHVCVLLFDDASAAGNDETHYENVSVWLATLQVLLVLVLIRLRVPT